MVVNASMMVFIFNVGFVMVVLLLVVVVIYPLKPKAIFKIVFWL